MERDMNYERDNSVYTEEDGNVIKCKNYEVCASVLPEWWFDCKGHYICTNCDIMFGTWGHGENTHIGKGTLEIRDNLECPICLEIKRSISQPRCEHTLCISCFKRCYFGDDNSEGEPEFPYPEIFDEYQDDPLDRKSVV